MRGLEEMGEGKVKITFSFPDWKEEQVIPVTVEVPAKAFQTKPPDNKANR